MLARAALSLAALAGFEPSCTSTEEYGWPRFSSLAELQASAWASYIEAAYGELPSVFPVCMYDMWALDKAAFDGAGLNTSRTIVTDPKAVKEGDLFVQSALGFFGYGIYHSHWAAAKDNTWIEVAHAVLPTEWTGAWTWRLRGSGVWVNVGKTIAFPTPADMSQVHMEAIHYLTENCSVKVSPYWPLSESDIFGLCAREKGFDSVQFEPQVGQAPLGTFGLTGLTELVLTRLSGNQTCGVPDASATPLRQGWRASSGCDCVNQPIPPTCGLMPFPPEAVPKGLVKPPLCEAQAENASVPCNALSCNSYMTACRHKGNLKRLVPTPTRPPLEWTRFAL
uniref:Phospholipase B-like n=1 Tax=Calcidiscus leptoporus TaxID=127549 RepID=A0A7S0IMV8_9EUKA|mmetsp:Transcript_13010/g.29970  ORF Transcript_13010/g.29970 Transcript_13010/m.29970 type:complete len:337 (+) Transcript_13010:168-1178(+)